MTTFERIEELRQKAGLSQGKLEKELHFSNGSISKWKHSTPTYKRLQKVADYFHVSVEYLMSGEEKPKEKAPELTARDERDIAKDLNNMVRLDQPVMTVNLWIQRQLLFLKMSWKLPFAD